MSSKHNYADLRSLKRGNFNSESVWLYVSAFKGKTVKIYLLFWHADRFMLFITLKAKGYISQLKHYGPSDYCLLRYKVILWAGASWFACYFSKDLLLFFFFANRVHRHLWHNLNSVVSLDSDDNVSSFLDVPNYIPGRILQIALLMQSQWFPAWRNGDEDTYKSKVTVSVWCWRGTQGIWIVNKYIARAKWAFVIVCLN